MSNVAIRVENLSKRYQLGTIGYGSLQHDLKAWWARARGKEDPNTKIGEKSRLDLHGEFWALKEVGFEVQKGDRVGIIGRNGAGKSTLLKLLSRVTSPTEGRISVRGRVASLLEVGTGFHPELTGRENIFLNGAILGMRRREIQAKFDEIVDFANVSDFIDTPVKRYSSGMYVRLAFSVAAHLNSEILIVDEVLAVGDAEFQKRSTERMRSLSTKEGKTILFVSHQTGFLETLCNKGILLSAGKVESTGGIDSVIRQYKGMKQDVGERLVWERGNVEFAHSDVIQVNRFSLERISAGASSITAHLELDLKRPEPRLGIQLVIYDQDGQPVLSHSVYDSMSPSEVGRLVGLQRFSVALQSEWLVAGDYSVEAWVYFHNEGWILEPNNETRLRFQNKPSRENYEGAGRLGKFNLPVEWRRE